MTAVLRRSPRFPLLLNPLASLSTAAAVEIDPPDPAAEALSLLKSAIRSETDPDRLAAAFESAAHQTRYHFAPKLFPLTINKLALAHRHDLISRLLNNSSSDPAAPHSDAFLAKIIRLYSTAGMLDQAVRIFYRAVAAARPVADRSFSALFSAFVKAGEFDSAVDVFNRCPKQLDITLGIAPHNIILQALCKKGDITAARQLFDEVANKDSPKPDIIFYTTMLHGYLLAGDDAGFTEILKQIGLKRLVCDAATYRCRIMALCRKEEIFKAEELLDVMVARGVLPDRACFKIIIEGYCNVGDMEAALRLLKRMNVMKGVEVVLEADTYTMLVRGLIEKGEFGSALEICNECLARKLALPFELVKELAERLRENSKIDEAKDIMERMKAILEAGGTIDAQKQVESEFSLLGA